MEKDKEIAYILNQFIRNESREIVDENVPIIKQPQYYKAELSLWSDLKQCDVDKLNSTTSVEELQSELATILDMEDYKEDKRELISMELFTYVISFSRERCFNDRQTSVLFSMFKRTHDIMKETPFSNLDQCIHFFTEMIYCHTIRRPPFSLDIFSVQEGRMVIDYAMELYFKHFKLYKYVFTPKVTLDLRIHYEGKPLTPLPDVLVCDLNLMEKKEEIEEKEDENKEAVPVKNDEKNGANKELKDIIEKYLSEELTQMKNNIENRMKMAEVELNISTGDHKPTNARKSAKKGKSQK